MTKKSVPTRRAFRQGELLFVPLSREDYARLFGEHKDIASLGWQKLDTNVIREGEATGHKHEVLTKLAATAALFAPPASFRGGLSGMNRITGEDRLLVANEPVEIVHPEHRPLTLPQGIHLIIIQRQYDQSRSQPVRD